MVATAEAYKCLTIEHIKSNNSVYQWVQPTRHKLGTTSYVKCPTEVTYRNQINSKRDSIKDQYNRLWNEIVEARSIEKKFAALFYAYNTTLPTLYTLVKTHRIPPGVDITSKSLEELKVRPIVSCSGSPSEKLATLATKIITPLLDFIPCHLKNIHEQLEIFKRINPDELSGLRFYTADVSALFTNVNVSSCIEDVIKLAAEYWRDIQTYGLEIVDLQRLLEVVLGNSFFMFNGRLYNQIYGVFNGCAASPPCAIIKLYKLEKESIYTDAYYLTNPIRLFYGRYVDDSGSFATSKEAAIHSCSVISSKDHEGRIKWEVEYSENDQQYVPFLDTEIRVDKDNSISSRYYRKPQNKGITLNYKSHHQLSTKESVARNCYKTAVDVSSGPTEREHSLAIVDGILSQNGYPNPRSFDTRISGTQRKNKRKSANNTDYTTLSLPYTTEKDANSIRNYIHKNKIPIRPIFTPGKTLKKIFCQSRPLDTVKCVLGNTDRCANYNKRHM